MCYVPQETGEAQLLAERLAPRLSHSNAAVVMTCIRVILYLMNYISDQSQITLLSRKLSPPLVTLLAKPSEIQYLALRNAILILQKRPDVLRNDIRVFFCKYNDPIYVKLTKLEIIFTLANSENIATVLAELREYSLEIDVAFVRKAVRAIGKLAIKVEPSARQCIDLLLELVATKVPYIVQEATVVIQNIFRKYPNQYESIISLLCENLDSLDEPAAKASMIWVIGQYADRIDNAGDLLEDFLYSFSEEPVEVQLALLTATVKLFIQRPTKGADLVPKVLKWCTEETDNPDLRDRGYMYWRLLSTDPATAKTIVMGEKPPITAESDIMDPYTLDDLCLNVGTLATVYLKPVNQIFRSARPRRLGESPALQKQKATFQDAINHASPAKNLMAAAASSPSENDDSTQSHGSKGDLAAAVDAADLYFAGIGSSQMNHMSLDDSGEQGNGYVVSQNAPERVYEPRGGGRDLISF
jgi:AP-2 complex subunit beta-1